MTTDLFGGAASAKAQHDISKKAFTALRETTWNGWFVVTLQYSVPCGNAAAMLEADEASHDVDEYRWECSTFAASPMACVAVSRSLTVGAVDLTLALSSIYQVLSWSAPGSWPRLRMVGAANLMRRLCFVAIRMHSHCIEEIRQRPFATDQEHAGANSIQSFRLNVTTKIG